MFWNYNQGSPQIDNVFCKEDLTLQELLDQENILQELKSQNKKLIDFLLKPDVLSELVTLITTEPPAELPPEDRYKHSHIACELLTTDIPSFTENLVKDPALLARLYGFLDAPPPLNPLLASFFSRTMGVLVVRRSEQNWYSYQFTCIQVIEFLKSKENSIALLLKHLGTSAIMDFALKLVTQIEGDLKLDFLNFLSAGGLVDQLVELLSPPSSVSVNTNAALLLCDIIVKSREAQLNAENKLEPDPVLSSLESTETINKILEVTLGGEKKESSIIGGIAVLLTLLEPVKPVGPSSVDSVVANYGGEKGDSPTPPTPPPSPVIVNTTQAITDHLHSYHDLLVNPPSKPGVRLTCCVVDPPLGITRLQVVRLLVALIGTHSQPAVDRLIALDTISVLLDLFFSYSWNNFLHTQVEKCLNAAMAVEPPASPPQPYTLLVHNIFVKCRLLNKILDAWNENEKEQSRPGGFRKGYMGHLTRLAGTINVHMEKGLGQLLWSELPPEELAAWQEFTLGPLAKVKAQLDMCLGGGKHPAQSNSDDDERSFRNVPFQQEPQFQQIYTEYQTQQMAPQFIEHFGYHESEFNDPEDNLNPSVDRLAHLSFSVTDEDELERQAEMFKQVCAQRLQTLDGDPGNDPDPDDEDVWADHGLASSRIWNGGEEIANYNSSDDEERPGPEGREEAHMEVDHADPWASSGPVADGPPDPWGGGTAVSAVDNTGWANFEANFTAFDSPATTTSPAPALAPAHASPSPAPVVPELQPDAGAPSIATESRSEPLGASSSEDRDEELEQKKDDNANLSLNAAEPAPIDEEQLIDNFRFLSSQGLIAEQKEVSNASASGDSIVQVPKSPERQSESETKTPVDAIAATECEPSPPKL